jgi:TonB-dependent receptor
MKYDTEIAGHPSFLKVGAKARLRGRDRDHNDRYYTRNRDWTLAGYDGESSIPSLVADYRATSLVDGRYDYGFYVDPKKVRSVADKLIAANALNLDPESKNGHNNQLYSYSADEDILATYVMGQIDIDKLTITTGVRVENTKAKFNTNQASTVWDDNADDGDGGKGAYVTTLTRLAPSNRYTNLMPGLHLRYDFTKRVALRASYTRTIARPTFSDLDPRELIDRDELTISRGKIDLKPVTSDNIDLSTEYYLGSVGYVSAGVFYKKLKNNIYTPNGFTTTLDGVLYKLSEPRNAEGGYVKGIELGYEQQFKFLPSPFDGFGITANWTYADSSVKTGYAAVPEIQLFDQVKNTVNAGIFYDKAKFRARLSWLYRSKTIPADYGINPDHPEIGRVIAGSTTLDFTASYRFAEQWTVYIELQNLLNTPGRAYDGNEALRLDYNEYTNWSGQVGVRWSL